VRARRPEALAWTALLTMALPGAAGCARALDDDQACFEAQVAMGARLEECTGDPAAARELMDALEADYACALGGDDPRLDPELADVRTGVFECAFVVRNLACELATTYDTDPAPWLTSAPVCELLWRPR